MARLPANDQFPAFEFRPNSGQFPGWGGVITEGDPGSLPSHRLRRVLNMRFKRGILQSRPGLSEVLDLSETQGSLGVSFGTITHIGQFGPGVGVGGKLWTSAHGCMAATFDVEGGSIINFDPDRMVNKVETVGTFFTALDATIPLGRFGDKLYFGHEGVITEITKPWLQPSDSQFTSTAVSVASGFNSPLTIQEGYRARWIVEFDSKVFFGLENATTPANSKIMCWDGLTLTDDITGVPVSHNACVLRDTLVVSFNTSVRQRDRGSSPAEPGIWGGAVTGVGFNTTEALNSMVEYREAVYIASGASNIWHYNGTPAAGTLTLARAIPDASVNALARHNGLLYYCWFGYPATADEGDTFIGRYDPDSGYAPWIDGYKDLTSQWASFKWIYTLVSYRNDLWCGSWLDGAPVHSPTNDIPGTWISAGGEASPVGDPDHPIIQLLEF